MYSLFDELLLIAIIGLIWGLLAPHHISEAINMKRPLSRAHTGLIFGNIILLFLILDGVTAAPQQFITSKNSAYTTSTTRPQVKGASVVIKQETDTQPIAFSAKEQSDSSLAKGQTKVIQVGVNGIETLTYQVTLTNGTQTSKTLQSTKVTTQPINQIVEVGTYTAPVQQAVVTTNPTPSPPQNTTPSQSSSSTTESPSTACYLPSNDDKICYVPGDSCKGIKIGTLAKESIGTSISSIICTEINHTTYTWVNYGM